jgi:hypothetical protein
VYHLVDRAVVPKFQLRLPKSHLSLRVTISAFDPLVEVLPPAPLSETAVYYFPEPSLVRRTAVQPARWRIQKEK